MPEGTPQPADSLPPTCEVRDWPVFANGTHKGELYPPAAIHAIVANFARLRGRLTPVAALGHDRQARLTASLGLPNVGEIVGVRTTDGRNLVLDIRNVPTWLGGMINAGRYLAGSVELKPHYPDPADASKRIDGPVIEAVAFLGEEPPEVKGLPPPRATFADGTEVPPNWHPLPVPSEVVATMSGDSKPTTRGRDPVLCFSESVMTPDEMKAALKDFLPEAAIAAMDEAGLRACYDAMLGGGAAAFSASMKKKFAADPTPDPKPAPQDDELKKFMAETTRCMSDLTKRMGDVEAAKVADQKTTEEAKVAAFSDRVEKVLDDNATRFAPALRPALKLAGMNALTAKTYGELSGDGEKAFAAWKAGIEAMPPNKLFSAGVVDKPAAAALNANAREVVKHMATVYPRVAARLLAAG